MIFGTTKDKTILYFRWVMTGVIFLDLSLSIIQFVLIVPNTSTHTNSPTISWLILPYIIYVVVAIYLVSVLPKKLSLITMLALILSHYNGALTSLSFVLFSRSYPSSNIFYSVAPIAIKFIGYIFLANSLIKIGKFNVHNEVIKHPSIKSS
jgi:hypothetical protein